MNEDVENKRRQREQAAQALEKQQRRKEQEQKTSSSSSSSSTSSTSSSSPKSSCAASPPAKSSSPPTSHPVAAMTSSAAAAASRLLQQRQLQEKLQQEMALSRPQTLKTEPSSPTWSQIEHLIPKLSPTQPQKSLTSPVCSPLQQQPSSQHRTTSLKRQLAFDSTAALQESVQKQLQQMQTAMQQQHHHHLQQQQQQQKQQEPPRLQSQLSIPESVSSFILSSEFSDSGKTQYEYPEPMGQQYQTLNRPMSNFTQQSSQPYMTASQYVAPPNFLHVASTSTSSPSQRTFQQHYLTKAISDPLNSSNISPNFLSMDSSPSTCSVSIASVPSFLESRDACRSRSLSNPSTMSSVTRQPHHAATHPQQMSGLSCRPTMPYSETSRTYQAGSAVVPSCVNISNTVATSSVSVGGLSLGLFSGNAMLPSASFPSTGIEESESPSSSDENVNEQDLFQFATLTPHKRTLSDPILHGGKVRKTVPERNVEQTQGYEQQQQQQQHQQHQRSLLASPAFFSSSADEVLLSDPRTTLKNLTTTRCFSSTRTSNTPSPSSSIGLVPMGVPSPTPSCSSGSRSGSFSRSSPASKSSVSPVPAATYSSGIPSLPSLSSLYDTEDFSSTLSPAAHAAVDTALDIYTSAAAASGSGAGFPQTDSSNNTSLQASIDLIPEEIYSYLADIQQSRDAANQSSLSSNTQGDVNLPDIDELLGNRDGSI